MRLSSTSTVNMHAKTHLPRLVADAAAGEPFVIARGRQAAGQGCRRGRTGLRHEEPARVHGRATIPEDFDRIAEIDGRRRVRLAGRRSLWAAVDQIRLRASACPNGSADDRTRLGRVTGEIAIEQPWAAGNPAPAAPDLLERDYRELPISGSHATVVDLLPPIHKDPFDRILVAQAQIEGLTLLTADDPRPRYPGPIRAL